MRSASTFPASSTPISRLTAGAGAIRSTADRSSWQESRLHSPPSARIRIPESFSPPRTAASRRPTRCRRRSLRSGFSLHARQHGLRNMRGKLRGAGLHRLDPRVQLRDAIGDQRPRPLQCWLLQHSDRCARDGELRRRRSAGHAVHRFARGLRPETLENSEFKSFDQGRDGSPFLAAVTLDPGPQSSSVPEPATWPLGLVALLAVPLARRRQP